jgi:hypothetical protein
MKSVADILAEVQRYLPAPVFDRLRFSIAPLTPIIPLLGIKQKAESMQRFSDEIGNLGDSIEASVHALPSADSARKKLETVAWWFAEVDSQPEFDEDWYTVLASVAAAAIEEVKGNTRRCFARTRKCPNCKERGEEGDVVCLICGQLIRPCLGYSVGNGRCKYHGGSEGVEVKEQLTLASQRAMLIKDDRRRGALLAIATSPDLLENTSDIGALELRQQEIMENLGEIDMVLLRAKLYKKLKSLQKSLTDAGADNALKLINEIVRESTSDERFWEEYRTNAVVLDKLRQTEHRRILSIQTQMSPELFASKVSAIRQAVALGIEDASRELLQIVSKEITKKDELIGEKLMMLAPASMQSTVERKLREAILKRISENA